MRQTTNNKKLVQAWVDEQVHYRLQQLARIRTTREGREVPLAELVREGIKKVIEAEG